jgi:hypothetical protein
LVGALKTAILELNSVWYGASPIPSFPFHSCDWPKFHHTFLYNMHISSFQSLQHTPEPNCHLENGGTIGSSTMPAQCHKGTNICTLT